MNIPMRQPTTSLLKEANPLNRRRELMRSGTLSIVLAMAMALAATACEGEDENGDADGLDGDEIGQILSDPQDGSVRLELLSASDIDESADLLSMLPAARMSLDVGFDDAASDGFVISGKFELSDEGAGPISLSVYTARAGKETIPEENELVELAGDPTGSTWTPGAEVFEDFEHIARSSQQLTLMQTTRVSLASVARAAASLGTVYRVEPAVRQGRPVFRLLVADEGGASEVFLALQPI
jgi:hypothetical protein